jgi:hypothetical protein
LSYRVLRGLSSNFDLTGLSSILASFFLILSSVLPSPTRPLTQMRPRRFGLRQLDDIFSRSAAPAARPAAASPHRPKADRPGVGRSN